LTDAKSQVLALEHKNNELAGAINLLEDEKLKITNDLNKLNQRLLSKESELGQSTNELHRLRQVETDQIVMLRELSGKVTSLTSAEDVIKVKLCETQRDFQNTQSQLEYITMTNQKLEQDNMKILICINNLEKKNESLTDELNGVKAELEASQKRLFATQESELNAKASSKKYQDGIESAVDDMKTKLEKSCNEIQSMMKHSYEIEVKSMASDLKRSNEENCHLLIKLQNCKEEFNAIKKTNNGMNIELNQTLEDLKEEKRQHKLVQVGLRNVSRASASI